MKKTSARTAKLLRDRGLEVDVAERWIPGARVRKDLFGIADLVAFDTDHVWLVQCCAAARLGDHMLTIQATSTAWDWVVNPGRRILVVQWKKSPAAKYGGSKKRPVWVYREIDLGHDLEPVIDTGWKRP